MAIQGTVGVPQEAVVQLAPDSTGKMMRNLAMPTIQPDGTVVTAYSEIVAIQDENGNVVPWNAMFDLVRELLRETRAVRLGIQQQLDAGALAAERNDLYEMSRDIDNVETPEET